MSVTVVSPGLEQAIANFYAHHQPDLPRNEFPSMGEQALRLLAYLVEQVVAPGVGVARWQQRHFITAICTQAVVVQGVSRLLGIPVAHMEPAAVRKVLVELSVGAWEGLAPDLAYPAETPYADARNHFKQALIDALKLRSQQPLQEQVWALLANVADDSMLHDYQRTWVQTLRTAPAPTTVLASRVDLLSLLQSEMRQAFPSFPTLETLAEFDLDTLADAYGRRLQLQTRLAAADAMTPPEHLELLRKVWEVRDAGKLYGDESTAQQGARINVGALHIKMAANNYLPLHGVLVVGPHAKKPVLLVAPHLGLELFPDLSALRTELARRFNEPSLLRPWLRYLPAQERALAGFHDPSTEKRCHLKRIKSDVFRHLAHGALERLRSDLVQVCQHAREGGAIESLDALGERIAQLLRAETAWVAEALEWRTHKAIESLDEEAIVQACHQQVRRGEALPLLGLPEALALTQVFRVPPAHKPEPVADDAYAQMARSYFAEQDAMQLAARMIGALPDYHAPAPGALAGLAAGLSRRLWTAPACLGESSGVNQSQRYKVFQFMVALCKQVGPPSAYEHLIVTNALLLEPDSIAPESAFTCEDWISAQSATQNWRSGVVHRYINGRGTAPDVDALCTFLDGPLGFEYAKAAPDNLADQVNPLLEALLDSPAFHRLEDALLKPAGWPADTHPDRRQALALAAITDYLYPNDTHRAGYLCGFNLYDPALGDRSWQQVQDALWGHLRRHFAGHSTQAVSLAAALLLRRHAPTLLVRDIPDTLLYGHTQGAVDFRHAVAVAEATVPGLAWRKRFAELEALFQSALKEPMTPMQQAACAALRSDPAIYFAMCRGTLSAQSLDAVSDDDAQLAIAFTREDDARREQTLNALLKLPPDRKEMAQQQLKHSAPQLDQDEEKPTDLTERGRLVGAKIRFTQWLGSLTITQWSGPIMSNLERYMTDLDGYGFNDDELGFASQGTGGPVLSEQFNKAYGDFERAHHNAQRQQMKDAILDLPADQRRELLAASRFVSVSFKGAEGEDKKLGYYGLLALGDGYAYELLCPSGAIRKVTLETGPDARSQLYYDEEDVLGKVGAYLTGLLPVYTFRGLPALDVRAHTEGRKGTTAESGKRLNYLFSNHSRSGTQNDQIEALCQQMVDTHFGKVISQLRAVFRRPTGLERYYQQWNEGIDLPLSFIVPFYALYLDIKNDQVSAATVVFGALELIAFLIPLSAAFRSGYTATVTLGRVVARSTSLGLSKAALRLAKARVAGTTFTKVLAVGVVDAMNPVPWDLLALLGRGGWKGARALSESLWRLRQIHPHLGTTHALAVQSARYAGWRAPGNLLSLPPAIIGRPEAVAHSFVADFSWGNRKLNIADQMSFHARDVDLGDAALQNHVYRLGEAEYVRMQGNVYQVQRMPHAELRIMRGDRIGPTVEYAPAQQQWRLAQGGLSGGLLPRPHPLPSSSRQVSLPLEGVAGTAPHFHVHIANQQVRVLYDVDQGGWRERRGQVLGGMVWRDIDGHWQRGTVTEFRNRPRGVGGAATHVRIVELPRIPAISLQLEPIPASVHYIWVGRHLPDPALLANMATNARQLPGFQSILHVDLDADTLQRLTTQAAERVPGLQISNLNDELFFQNLRSTPLGEQYRHIIDAPQPYYPAASQVLRYPLLNEYGGIYLNLDNVILGRLQPGNLTGNYDELLLGSWTDSPLGTGYEPSRFASHPNNRVLQAISAEMTQRYQSARAHYDSIAPRETREQVLAFYREHSRLTGTALFNQVMAQREAYPTLPQLSLTGNLGIYDGAYQLALYHASVHHFPFATSALVQGTRVPYWQQDLARFDELFSEPVLLERMQALNVPGRPFDALIALRAQGRSDEAIAQTLSTMALQRARMTEALDQYPLLALFNPGQTQAYRVTYGTLMSYWQVNAWAAELNQARVALHLDLGMISLRDLPSFFYEGVHSLRLRVHINPFFSDLDLSRFSNLARLDLDCSGVNRPHIIPLPDQVPRLTHLRLRNLENASTHLASLRNITTLRSLDLSGARGLVWRSSPFLDLTGFSLHSIVLDRCQLSVFPRGDFSTTERMSLVDNLLATLPQEVLTNPITSARPMEIVLRGNPMSQEIQAQMLFGTGSGRRYRFTFDDTQLSADLRQQVESWRSEAEQIRRAFMDWRSTRPLPDAVVEARRLLGERMQEAHREYRSSGMRTSMTLEHLSALPPANLPEEAYLAVGHLNLHHPALDHNELGQLLLRFPALRSLVISNPSEALTRLPERLRDLAHLHSLQLSELGFEIDQRAMDVLGDLADLYELNLSGNRLGQIDYVGELLTGNADGSASLLLSHMDIERVPDWIDAHLLSRLENLDLSNNRLRDIPEDLFSNDVEILEGTTQVVLLGNPLDPHLSRDLHESMSLWPDADFGPRFSFHLDQVFEPGGQPIPRLHGHPLPGAVPLANGPGPWLQDLDEAEVTRRRLIWQGIEQQADAPYLMMMVNQLRETADFRHAGRRPELIESVWRVLEQAQGNGDLRRRFNEMAEEGARMRARNETCVDGVRMEFARIETEASVHQALPQGVAPEHRGVHLYHWLRSKYRSDAVEIIANRQAGARDVAEVRLAYLIGTRKALKLATAPRSMVFRSLANVHADEMSDVAREVIREERLGGLLDYAPLQPFWTHYLRERYAERFAILEAEYRQRVLDVDDSYPAASLEERAARVREMEEGYEMNQQALIRQLTTEEGDAYRAAGGLPPPSQGPSPTE